MKILISADHHIKIGQKNVPKEWALNRYRSFFNAINNIECDEHFMLGDLFDKIPSLEELELYFEFVKGSKHKTYLIDGNHEATKKGRTFLSQLKNVTTSLNPNFYIIDSSEAGLEYGYQFLPYCELHKAKEILATFDKSKPVFTHVRGAISPHVKPEIDLGLFEEFPVVFAGDLHSHKNSQLNIVYPGSPVTTSFHRNETLGDNGYILLDTDTLKWTWHEFKLPQLIKKTITNSSEAVATEYHHTIYEIEGSIQDLSTVPKDLVASKKLTTVKTNTTSILKSNQTMTEKVYAYLTQVLKIENVERVMKLFNDKIRPS